MRVLVTGSEGSLMQATIPYLLRKGHEVRGVDNFFRYGRLERRRDYEFIEGDLCDISLAEKACRRIDVVIQAAARIFGVGGFHKYPADILSSDVVLQQNILRGALNNHVRKVVYISSSMVYERVNKMPLEETEVENMPIPLTDYGLSKLVGERLCQAFYAQYGLLYTIWRPFNIITPSERGEKEPGISHVFADFIKKIILDRQNPVEIFGDGQQIRCFTWIEDVASAIASYSFEGATDCEAFNLGNPEPVTMTELATRIYDMAKGKGMLLGETSLGFKHFPAYEDDVRVRIPSIEKARRVLGWQPKVGLDQALSRCLDAVQKGAKRA